jgi:hypothetical protein
MSILVFHVVTPCGYQHFGGTYRLPFQGRSVVNDYSEPKPGRSPSKSQIFTQIMIFVFYYTRLKLVNGDR